MSRARVLLAVLSVLLVAALVACALTWRAWRHERDLNRASEQATVAAKTAATQMTSYAYSSLDHDFSWVDDAGTARFRSYFREASARTKPLITSLKATAKGTVVDAAATAKDADHVKVLLYVDQTITAKGKKGSERDQPRVTMTMVHRGGRWLVDKVELNNLVAK